MPENKNTEDKMSFVGFDPVETPEEIIATDKDTVRKEAFKEAYKKIMAIVPNYFLQQKKRKTGSSGTSGGFSQEIKITPENIKVETKGEISLEEKDRERED